MENIWAAASEDDYLSQKGTGNTSSIYTTF